MTETEELREDLLRYLRRKFSNFDDIGLAAEDIVGQAYVNALKAPRGRELVGNFGYMAAICERVAFRLYRSSMAESASRATGVEPDEVDGGEDPAGLRLDEEAIAAVAASLETLREIERVIIERRYYGEVSFAEIARKTGLPLNTVLSQHRRALLKLRPRLAAYFDEAVGAGEGQVVRSQRGPISKLF